MTLEAPLGTLWASKSCIQTGLHRNSVLCTLLKSGLTPVLIFPTHTLCASLTGPSQYNVHLIVLHALGPLKLPQSREGLDFLV